MVTDSFNNHLSMSLSFKWLLSVSLALTNVFALSIPSAEVIKKDDKKALQLTFDVKQNRTSENTLGLSRRGDLPVEIYNTGHSYTVELLVGEPKQSVGVSIDTGSSDLWIPANSAGGVYEPTRSSTFKDLGSDFVIHYGKGDVNGTYATENFFLTDDLVEVKNLQFGLANSTADITTGLLGIARPNQEAAKTKYDNLPIQLKNQGIIDKVAYSLYLNSPSAASGTILFGAIDRAKYKGELAKQELAGTKYLATTVKSADYGGKSYSTPFEPILDSGATIIYLPQDLASAVQAELGADGDEGVVSCDQPSDKYLTLNFEGTSVSIPYTELVWPAYYECVPAVRGPVKGQVILGDVFLRHAYVYYDLEENYLSLAPVNYTTESDIQIV